MKELIETLKNYLEKPSVDGHPSRQPLRKKLTELLNELEKPIHPPQDEFISHHQRRGILR